jgi:hypothetical protein
LRKARSLAVGAAGLRLSAWADKPFQGVQGTSKMYGANIASRLAAPRSYGCTLTFEVFQ